MALERGNEVVSKNLNAVDQLQKVSNDMNQLLDLLSRWSRGDEKALKQIQKREGFALRDPRELMIKTAGEIREQILTQLELLKALYSFKEVENFMDEIISVIGECDEEVRNKIISRLNQRRLIRGAIDPNKSETEA